MHAESCATRFRGSVKGVVVRFARGNTHLLNQPTIEACESFSSLGIPTTPSKNDLILGIRPTSHVDSLRLWVTISSRLPGRFSARKNITTASAWNLAAYRTRGIAETDLSSKVLRKIRRLDAGRAARFSLLASTVSKGYKSHRLLICQPAVSITFPSFY